MKIKYIAECGKSFDTEEEALMHEEQHKSANILITQLG